MQETTHHWPKNLLVGFIALITFVILCVIWDLTTMVLSFLMGTMDSQLSPSQLNGIRVFRFGPMFAFILPAYWVAFKFSNAKVAIIVAATCFLILVSAIAFGQLTA